MRWVSVCKSKILTFSISVSIRKSAHEKIICHMKLKLNCHRFNFLSAQAKKEVIGDSGQLWCENRLPMATSEKSRLSWLKLSSQVWQVSVFPADWVSFSILLEIFLEFFWQFPWKSIHRTFLLKTKKIFPIDHISRENKICFSQFAHASLFLAYGLVVL